MIVLSASMPRAGSAWFHGVTNDLLVAAGYTDVKIIRARYHLQSILKWETCIIDQPSPFKFMVLIPHFLGHTFAVKTHKPPTRNYRLLISLHIAKATYIYRDPRDAALSAFEFGQNMRKQGRTDRFASLDTMEKAIQYYTSRLKVFEAWINYGKVLFVKYEDLLLNPLAELERLAQFLSLDISTGSLQSIIQKDLPGKAGKLHFNKGIVGRFRQIMTPQEKELCHNLFGNHLTKMGYDE